MKIQTTDMWTFYLIIFDNFIDQAYMCGAALHSSKFLEWENFMVKREFFPFSEVKYILQIFLLFDLMVTSPYMFH